MIVVGLHLVDAGQAELNGIFDSGDVFLGRIDTRQHCVHRGGLAGTGWASDDDHAVRLLNQILADLNLLFRHPERFKAVRLVVFIEHSHDDFLAVDGRNAAHAKARSLAGFFDRQVAVLRSPLFGGVHVGHDFDSADDGFFAVIRNRHDLLKFAVDPVSDPHLRTVWFEVDIAGAGVDGPHQD